MMQRASLYLYPPFEFRRFRYVKAVEKGSGVAGHGAIQVSGLNGSSKVDPVARHYVGVETDLVTAQKQVLLAQVTAQGIERLSQDSTRLLWIALRPEETEDFVPREAPVAGPVEQSQEGKPSTLRPRSLDRTLIPLDG
jgi:hypothetical protein